MPRFHNWIAVLCALAATLALVPAGAAQVTGLYYQEERKDGRIYVFNTPETYREWKASGEMGKSITLPGTGPQGETVVAENETALDLFLFKHGLPAYERDTPKPEKPPFTIAWKDGKTTIDTQSGQLKLSNRVQVRFTQEEPDQGDGRGSFRIRRAKTKFEGWVYTEDLTYELQMNWASSNFLEDANINYDFTAGEALVMVKAGQFKVPFGRQELTSSGSQQFVDRSIVSDEFARGRDLGIQLWGTPAGGAFDWRVGIFNGGGINSSRNDNDEYQMNARLTWQPFGDVKYSEGDFDSSDRPLFALAGGYESNDRHGATTGNDNDRRIVAADAAFKYKGLSAFAEYFDARNELETGARFDSQGLHAQIGYFVIPKRLEVAARWAEIDPTDALGDDQRTETGAAVGYFWNKHNHKLQADFRQIDNEATDQTDDEFRLQYQIIF